MALKKKFFLQSNLYPPAQPQGKGRIIKAFVFPEASLLSKKVVDKAGLLCVLGGGIKWASEANSYRALTMLCADTDDLTEFSEQPTRELHLLFLLYR